MRGIVKDGVGRLYEGGIRASGLTRIQVAVEAREVAAADFQADAVALEEDIARGPHVDFVLVDLAGNDGPGLGGRFAITGAENPFGKILREAIGPYIN